LDLWWGYNNICIKEGDEWKAAFSTNCSAFEPLVMYFGLCNSPAIFQNMMNDIFKDLVNQNIVIVYIDDILIYTESKEKHNKIVAEVLKRLEDNDLYVKPEKCEWEMETVKFLGMVLSFNGIEMQKEKTQTIFDWPTPTCVKDVQRFVGFANYYRRFIEQFSKVASPLYKLTKKEKPWAWEPCHQAMFDMLKRKFSSHLFLVNPDLTKPLRVESDASNFATGAILSMKCDDDKWRPCAYLSKGLTK
jgi:hypothetical protein